MIATVPIPNRFQQVSHRFDLILIGGEDSWWTTIPVASWVIVVSIVLVLSCGQTNKQTQTHTRTDAVKHFTPANVGVSIKTVEQFCVRFNASIIYRYLYY